MKKIKVTKIVSSRYSETASGHKKPKDWDSRISGVDIVTDDCGKTVKLLSDGGQSVPEPSWDIVLMSGDDLNGYRWTLFGMPKTS